MILTLGGLGLLAGVRNGALAFLFLSLSCCCLCFVLLTLSCCKERRCAVYLLCFVLSAGVALLSVLVYGGCAWGVVFLCVILLALNACVHLRRPLPKALATASSSLCLWSCRSQFLFFLAHAWRTTVCCVARALRVRAPLLPT